MPRHGRSRKDQREHPRHEADLSATFYNERQSGFVKIGNISRGGCKIESHARIMPGEIGQLLVDLPGRLSALKVSKASVRWARGNDYGLQFLRIEEEDDWIQYVTARETQ